MAVGKGTREEPWLLKTPGGNSEYTAFRDEKADPSVLIVTVGRTVLHYQLRCLEDLQAVLKSHGDWMLLGKRRRAEASGGGDGGGVGALA